MLTDKKNPDDLVAVTYISHSLVKLADIERECERIALTSSINNSKREISGLLIYCRHRFIQRLEGKRQHIDDLIDTIKKDSRHRKFTILHYASIDKRHFTEWDQMQVITEPKHLDSLDQLFIGLESGGREVLSDQDSRYILNFIQHF